MDVNTYSRAKVRKDGSINIPKTVRLAAGISGGDIIEYAVHGQEVRVRVTKRVCSCCARAMSAAVHFGPVDICPECNEVVLGQIRKGKELEASLAYAATKFRRMGRK